MGRGLVTRTEDPSDRRTKLIALTDAGREITGRMVELRVAGITDFIATLDPDQRKSLAEVLEPIVAGAQFDVPASPAPRKDSNA